MSPLLAQSRHGLLHCTCPLSGVKRHVSATDKLVTTATHGLRTSSFTDRDPYSTLHLNAALSHSRRISCDIGSRNRILGAAHQSNSILDIFARTLNGLF